MPLNTSCEAQTNNVTGCHNYTCSLASVVNKTNPQNIQQGVINYLRQITVIYLDICRHLYIWDFLLAPDEPSEWCCSIWAITTCTHSFNI